MVTRLYGTVNGSDVAFKLGKKGLWEVDVPKLAFGEYYMSLTAEDAAGNQGFFVGLVLTYSVYGLSFRWIDYGYRAEVEGLKWIGGEKVKEFTLGEEKYVTLEVFSNYGQDDFVISEADWELLKDGELEDTGICRVDKHLISSLIEPKEPRRFYELVVTFTIGAEKLKQRIKLEVKKP